MAPATGPAPASAEIQEELRRVLASSAFSRPRRLARLLKHLVEHTLAGKEEHLKETVLGIEVFDRGQDFDPRTDPIVRIDARRLRARLAQYYSDEGAANPLIIVMEPGSYVPSFRRRSDSRAEAAGASDNRRNSVAVLPFTNLTDQPEYELFCEGLSEDLINRLAQHKGLRVIARASAFQFRDPTRDPRHIARQLRVNTLVTGTVRGHASEVRITAQLVNAEDSTVLWSQEYEHETDSMLETQETISRDIVGRFLGRANGAQHAAKITPDRKDAEAQSAPAHSVGNSVYRLFLKGRRLFHQGDSAGYSQGTEALEAAIKLDPTYAPAWGTLALACASLLSLRARNPKPLIARARAAAERALELDQLSLDAHAANGMVAGLADFNWAEARRWFDRALEINPLYAIARTGRAILWFAPTMQLDEAEDELESVLSNDPLNAEAMLNLGRVLYMERRFEMAAEMMQGLLDSNPENSNACILLAFAHEQMGMKTEALQGYRRWAELLSASFAKAWAQTIEHIMTGNRRSAERTTRKIAAMARFTPFPMAGFVADLYLRLEDYEAAIDWLEKAYKERAIRLVCAAVDPAFDPLREHSRFKRLVATILGTGKDDMAEHGETVTSIG